MKINAKNTFSRSENHEKFIMYNISGTGLYIIIQEYYFGGIPHVGCFFGLVDETGVQVSATRSSSFVGILPEPYKKIASFYVCLSEINQILGRIFESEQMRNPNFKWEIPVCGILTEQSLFMAGGSEGSMDYWTISESKNNPEEVEIFGEETIRPFKTFLPYPEGKARISKKEFYLLMQIYYGVYGEQKLYENLKQQEQEGKYAEIQKLYELYGAGKEEQLDWERLRDDVNNGRYNYNEELLNEYLMIKLLEKDTTGVFEGLEIRKIYDERWSDEDKKLNEVELKRIFWFTSIFVED